MGGQGDSERPFVVRQEFRECAADLRFQTCFKKLGRLDAMLRRSSSLCYISGPF